jgi:uncharacterized membrane protein
MKVERGPLQFLDLPAKSPLEDEDNESIFEYEDILKDNFDKLGRDLQKLNRHVQELNRSLKDSSVEQNQVLVKYENANSLSKSIQNQLKELTQLMKERRRTQDQERDINAIREMIFGKLATDYEHLRKELQNISSLIRKREKESIQQRRKATLIEQDNTSEIQPQKQNEFNQLLLMQEDEFKVIEYQEEDELAEIEQGVKDLEEMFSAVHHEVVHVQEEKLKEAQQNIDDAAIMTELGTKDLQTAAKWKTIGAVVGATALGGVVGCAIGGPIGAVLAAKTAFGLATTVGAGTILGFSIGATGGLVTKMVSDKVNGANIKFWKRKSKETEQVPNQQEYTEIDEKKEEDTQLDENLLE